MPCVVREWATSARIAAAVAVERLIVATWSSCWALLPKGIAGRTTTFARVSAAAAACSASVVASIVSVPWGRW